MCLLSLIPYQHPLCIALTNIRLLTAVTLHHLISSITVSTTGSALMMLIRELSEAAPLYVAAHFLKWHPGGAERREQTYHAD